VREKVRDRGPFSGTRGEISFGSRRKILNITVFEAFFFIVRSVPCCIVFLNRGIGYLNRTDDEK
jgi:hypothetical protein